MSSGQRSKNESISEQTARGMTVKKMITNNPRIRIIFSATSGVKSLRISLVVKSCVETPNQ